MFFAPFAAKKMPLIDLAFNITGASMQSYEILARFRADQRRKLVIPSGFIEKIH